MRRAAVGVGGAWRPGVASHALFLQASSACRFYASQQLTGALEGLQASAALGDGALRACGQGNWSAAGDRLGSREAPCSA